MLRGPRPPRLLSVDIRAMLLFLTPVASSPLPIDDDVCIFVALEERRETEQLGQRKSTFSSPGRAENTFFCYAYTAPRIGSWEYLSMKVGVVVIGAGPAGVTAARELKEKGISAVVVEAQGRIGGRILNTHDPTNTPEIRNFSKFPRENPPTSPQHTLQEFQTREGPTTSSCLVVQVTGAVPWSSRPPRPLLCFHRTRSARSRRDDPVKERAMKEGIFGPRASLERGPPVHPIGPESVSCS